jgi:hypothetical protein
MDETWKGIVWRQFGAAIDMLGEAIRACPDEVWDDGSRRPFWYIAYHTLFFLDLCHSFAVEGFVPPEPFTLSELEYDEALPERPYTQAELLSYLEHGRAKCRATIDAMTVEEARRPCDLFWLKEMSRGDVLLQNLRHVQHHTAQLYLILRQTTDSAPGWVKVAR